MKAIPCFLITELLVGCDGQTIVEHRLDNASSRTVRMVFHADDYHGFEGDTLVLAPGSITRVGWNDMRGGRRDYRRPAEGIDSVHVEVDGGGSLHRDLRSDAEWAVDSKGKGIRGSFSHICTFRFTDADID